MGEHREMLETAIDGMEKTSTCLDIFDRAVDELRHRCEALQATNTTLVEMHDFAHRQYQAACELVEQRVAERDASQHRCEALEQERDAAIEVQNRCLDLKTMLLDRDVLVKSVRESLGEVARREVVLTARCKALEGVLREAPTGKPGETHGDVIARYYKWYETVRADALAAVPPAHLRKGKE